MLPTDGERQISRSPDRPPGQDLTAERLAEQFWDRIRVFAARRVENPAAAEDVAQETIRRVVAAVGAGRLASLEALPGFVFQTARNICLQRHRSASREARALSRLATEEATSGIESDPLVRLISEEQRARVRLAMTQLVEGDRDLIRLLYFDD